MEILVLNSNFDNYALIDSFESLIWTDRYNGFGDFEIYAKASLDLIDLYDPDNETYLVLKNTEHVMLIEDCEIKFDAEAGDHVTLTGRSLESILNRRILWGPTVLSGNLQNAIGRMLDENVINPTDPNRTIDNFIMDYSTDPVITALNVEAQFTEKDYLYDVIVNLCKANNIGFKITLNENKQFVFKLYAGVDRSYAQFKNPYVIFSKEFGNLMSSSLKTSKKDSKNYTIVYGEGKDPSIKKAYVGGKSFLARKEILTDASSISQTVNNIAMSDADYANQLIQKGIQTLNSHRITNNFAGTIDHINSFKYGVDFLMGDIVQIDSDYGIQNGARISEMITSQTEKGLDIYPTFQMN